MDERRSAPRMRTLKSGKIFLGAKAVPCTIRNLSQTGACLQLQTTYGIPGTFNFAIADERRLTCKVMWLDHIKLGVQFQQRHPGGA